MSAVFDHHAHGVEEYVRAFPAASTQVGALFALGEEVLGLDCFERRSTLGCSLPKLVRSWALDALEVPPVDRLPNLAAALGLLEAGGESNWTAHRAVGLGQDVRLQADGLAGGGLEWEGRLVHLALFRLRESPSRRAAEGVTRMASASTRRRMHRVQ